MMTKFVTRATDAARCVRPVVPAAFTRIEEGQAQVIEYDVFPSLIDPSEKEAKVAKKGMSWDPDWQRPVRLTVPLDGSQSSARCSCRMPEQHLLPCKHVLAVCHQLKIDAKLFIGYPQLREAWQKTYAVRMPIVLSDHLGVDSNIVPPPIKSGLSRPTERRGETGWAPTQASQARSSASVRMEPYRHKSDGEVRRQKCGKCGLVARHNKLTCKAERPSLADGDDWDFLGPTQGT